MDRFRPKTNGYLTTPQKKLLSYTLVLLLLIWFFIPIIRSGNDNDESQIVRKPIQREDEYNDIDIDDGVGQKLRTDPKGRKIVVQEWDGE